MNRVILQVPMQKMLRDKATKAAVLQGFSSLQEAIRVMLQKLANKEISIKMEQKERLSPAQEKRYAKIIADIKKGKNITKTKNLDELFTQLNA